MKENNNPQISVCIPIYNVEKYIERCLRSVFEQTIADKAEFILVDDCSQDQSMSIAEKVIDEYPNLRNQIRIFRHEINKGLASARNTALMNSFGKYLIHVDSDDWCNSDYLELLYCAAECEDADIVCCNLIKEYQNYKRRTDIVFPDNPTECIRKLLSGDLPGWLHIKLISKRIFEINKIMSTENIDLHEDLILSVKVFSKAKKIINIEKALYHYKQQNTQSLSIRKTLSSDKCLQMIESVKEIERFLREQDTISLYEEDLKKRKILTKTVILLKVEKRNRKQYYNLYGNELKKIKNLNLKFFILCSILRFYDFRLYFIGNFIFNIIRFLKR